MSRPPKVFSETLVIQSYDTRTLTTSSTGAEKSHGGSIWPKAWQHELDFSLVPKANGRSLNRRSNTSITTTLGIKTESDAKLEDRSLWEDAWELKWNLVREPCHISLLLDALLWYRSCESWKVMWGISSLKSYFLKTKVLPLDSSLITHTCSIFQLRYHISRIFSPVKVFGNACLDPRLNSTFPTSICLVCRSLRWHEGLRPCTSSNIKDWAWVSLFHFSSFSLCTPF